MMSVVVAPWDVTKARVGVVLPGGQFTPFCKHTFCPETWSDDVKILVPEAVLNPNQEVEVTLPTFRLPRSAFVPVRFAANRFVEVVLVPVALVQIRSESVVGAPPKTVKFWKIAFVA